MRLTPGKNFQPSLIFIGKDRIIFEVMIEPTLVTYPRHLGQVSSLNLDYYTNPGDPTSLFSSIAVSSKCCFHFQHYLFLKVMLEPAFVEYHLVCALLSNIRLAGKFK